MGALTTYAQVMAETQLEWARDAVANIGDVQVATAAPSAARWRMPTRPPTRRRSSSRSTIRLCSARRAARVVVPSTASSRAVHDHGRPDEILVAVRARRCPTASAARTRTSQLARVRDGRRRRGHRGAHGAINHARVALTGVGEFPYRGKEPSSRRCRLGRLCLGDCGGRRHATDGVSVNSDIHANAAYRSAMAVVHPSRDRGRPRPQRLIERTGTGAPRTGHARPTRARAPRRRGPRPRPEGR